MQQNTFPEGKTARELGLQAGDKIIVVDNSPDGANIRLPNGTTLTLDDDLDYEAPWCNNERYCIMLRGCAYADPKKMDEFVKSHPEWYTSEPGFHKGGLIPGKTIVIDEDGDELMVMEAGENSFMPSANDSMESACASWFSYEEAKRLGWKIKEEPRGRMERKTVKYTTQEHLEEVKKNSEKLTKFKIWLAELEDVPLDKFREISDKANELFGGKS